MIITAMKNSRKLYFRGYNDKKNPVMTGNINEAKQFDSLASIKPTRDDLLNPRNHFSSVAILKSA